MHSPNSVNKQLVAALDQVWRKYRKSLKNCHRLNSTENIHALRVSTRRLCALLECLNALAPQPALAKLRKSLKSQLDQFDELRDIQVMMFETAKDMPLLPELEPFLAYMHQREQALVLSSQAAVAGFYQLKLRRKIKKAGKHFLQLSGDTDLNAALSAAIEQVYQTAIQRYQALDSDNLASFHHLRIALKKLRYILLSVNGIAFELPESYLKQLQAYLTHLGNIQNSAVLIHNLEAFFQHNPPLAITSHYQQSQQALVEAVHSLSDIVLVHWSHPKK